MQLTTEIANFLNTRVADVICDRFPEGEIHVQIRENIRGKDIFIVQSTSTPPNDHLMELLILIDAARRACFSFNPNSAAIPPQINAASME